MKGNKVDQLTHMIRLLKLLETSERTISNLALEIGISQRTVARYMDVFRSIGFCIVRDDWNQFTLLNTYGVPRLKLTQCEVESLIIICTEYYTLYSRIPSITVETALFKIAESIGPDMVAFLKETLHFDDGEVNSNMFNQTDTPLASHSAWSL